MDRESMKEALKSREYHCQRFSGFLFPGTLPAHPQFRKEMDE